MMHLLRVTACLWLFFPCLVLSQAAFSSSSAIPACASQCMDASATSSGCDTGDMSCNCEARNDDGQDSLTDCVQTYCSAPDASLTFSTISNICELFALDSLSTTTSTSISKTTRLSSTTSATLNTPLMDITADNTPTSEPTATPPVYEPIHSPPNRSGLSGGAKAGIITSVLGVAGLVAGLVFFCLRQRRQHRDGNDGSKVESRWPKSSTMTTNFGHDRRQFTKLSSSSNNLLDPQESSADASSFPQMVMGNQRTMGNSLPLGNCISVETSRPKTSHTHDAPTPKSIPLKGILRPPQQHALTLNENNEWPESAILSAPTIHKTLGEGHGAYIDNSPTPNAEDKSSITKSRPVSCSTVSEMSSIYPATSSLPADHSLRRPPNSRFRDSKPVMNSQEVSRFSMSSLASRLSGSHTRSLRNSMVSQRLSTATNNQRASRAHSHLSVSSEDNFRNELARMTLGYMPYPSSMPNSPPPIPQRFLDAIPSISSSNIGFEDPQHHHILAPTLGHKSIPATLSEHMDIQTTNKTICKPELRISVPGAPPGSVFSDEEGTPRTEGSLDPYRLGSPVVRMASVQEAARARLVIVKKGSKGVLSEGEGTGDGSGGGRERGILEGVSVEEAK